MEHLVYECGALHELTGPPQLHELCANFALMGIIEQPWFLIRRCPLVSAPRPLLFDFQPAVMRIVLNQLLTPRVTLTLPAVSACFRHGVGTGMLVCLGGSRRFPAMSANL